MRVVDEDRDDARPEPHHPVQLEEILSGIVRLELEHKGHIAHDVTAAIHLHIDGPLTINVNLTGIAPPAPPAKGVAIKLVPGTPVHKPKE